MARKCSCMRHSVTKMVSSFASSYQLLLMRICQAMTYGGAIYSRKPCCDNRIPDIPLLLTLIVVSVMVPSAGATSTVSDKLLQDLLKNYSRHTRPICGPFPATVQAYLGLSLRQLIDIDEPKQSLITTFRSLMEWHDCRLSWNMSNYGSIPRIIVPRYRVWIPDLALEENIDSKLGEKDDNRLSVYYDGSVYSAVHMVIRSLCGLNVRYFPYDCQTCNLTFGSWAYRGHEVNFSAADIAIDLSHLIEHGEWDLVNLTHTRVVERFDGVPYPKVVFTLYIRRKSTFYNIILILPSLLLQALSIIGFILPPDSGEKVTLEITILLSDSVFLLVLKDTLPSTSDHIPVVALSYMLGMVFVTLSCITTVIVMRFYFATHAIVVPPSVRAIMRSWFGRLYGMDKLISPVSDHIMAGWCGRFYGVDILIQAAEAQSQSAERSMTNIIAEETAKQKGQLSGGQELVATSMRMLTCLRKLSGYKQKKTKRDLVEGEWRILGILFDRVFLTVFLIAESLCLIAIVASLWQKR